MKHDKNFSDSVKLLNLHNFKYWIGNGTLLGIIRDNELISWDHDLDFCMWDKGSDKLKIIKLFKKMGFELIHYSAKFDYLSFKRRMGRVVDINFYHIDCKKNITFSIWPISTGKIVNKIFHYFLFHKNFFFLTSFINVISILFKSQHLIKVGSYFIPINYLRYFTYINFNGLMIRIPTRYQDILRHLYGYSWKIPKKKFNWVKDSPSTRTT